MVYELMADGRYRTKATAVYSQIRQDIFSGVFRGKSKIRIEWVVDRYGAGASPVREALNRLATEGLLVRHDQRGFSIKPETNDELDELTRTRCWLESLALRQSILSRTEQWEENLVLSSHRLTRATAALVVRPSSSDPEWEQIHCAFHKALIAGCGSKWLISFCERLGDQMHRYRVFPSSIDVPQRDCALEHRLIAEASLDGDTDRAVKALTEHFELSAQSWKAAHRKLLNDSS